MTAKTFEFVGEYGDRWSLILNPDTQTGFLSGSETDGEQLPVYGGCCYGIILGTDEAEWIRQCWDETMKAGSPMKLRQTPRLQDTAKVN